MMANMRLHTGVLRNYAFALAISLCAAVATMFVPASVLEGFTGSSGLSEIFPATAAPLGDTARALIAFGTGAITLLFALALVMRKFAGAKSAAKNGNAAVDTDPSLPENSPLSRLKDRIAAFDIKQSKLPKMPWHRGEDDIFDLADLPKLRANDVHPDAPPRRPLMASSDLALPNTAIDPVYPEPDMVRQDSENSPENSRETTVVHTEMAVAEMDLNLVPSGAGSDAAPAPSTPSLADMISQLEASVEQRKAQLAELEIVAAGLAHETAQPIATEQMPIECVTPPENDNVDPIPEASHPTLIAVPTPSALQEDAEIQQEDEMDVALSAALETLRRMNARGG